jgi:hypothetical protein
LIDKDNQEQQSRFTLDELFKLILSNDLVDTLKTYCSISHPKVTIPSYNTSDRFIICKIIFQVADTILTYYKKQNLYEQQAYVFLKSGIMTTLIQIMSESEIIIEN